MSLWSEDKRYHEHVRIDLAVNLGSERLLREYLHGLIKLREVETGELSHRANTDGGPRLWIHP